MNPELIKIQNLSKHFKVLNRHAGLLGAAKDLFSRDYKIVTAVDQINMTIGEGEIVGFLGPNGAGKSTTIKMMTGVLEPTSGQLSLNGCVPFEDRLRYVQNIGVVFGQRTQLWWDLPVIESFKILKEIYRVDQRSYDENMTVFNELVDIKSLYRTPVRHLSLGQRMLCDIVASFLHNPKIIFLDEPSIGLDVSIKDKIRTVIKDLNTRKKTTIILTSHDVGDIQALCKRVIVIDKGKIIYDGELEKFHRLFGAYRTLTVEVQSATNDITEKLNQLLSNKFSCRPPISVKGDAKGKLSLNFNQDQVELMKILNVIMNQLEVKDLRVEETPIESVIQKVYEEGLE